KRKTGGDTWVDYLLFAPDLFHLLCKLLIDKRVESSDKAKLLVAVTYFISPLDLVPELFLGPLGYVDDIALAAYVLNDLLNNNYQDIIQEHWAGSEDVLGVIKSIIDAVDEMLGSGLWKKIRRYVSK
ncbi:DUF1232 domain-containing protein, partial [bacterium]|nr:DUF1232 domain-containing protein [bacterium]